ncbi:glycosyltransferase [Pontibacter arcticus]|uniref:Glycoside hydrolase family 2 protein n=1 Tax=Pontibacter arcticus TaxID=2080288 RepID=A0A364RDX1_9BACT|nr:glycosyltransferase [Pontibacter arcticus]RAU82366.1 glycoside hydrolase family 2 protein [Pontibacter arcticus]
MYNEQEVSIIIPTHNRPESLGRLLNGLAVQDYPMHLLEVIVVADGCNNQTKDIVAALDVPYKLQLIELTNQGPSVARNRGVAVAQGTLLIFLDDDLEPCPGLVQAHVLAHTIPNRVVIGYLPYKSTKLTGKYITRLRSWWESKFYTMRQPGYRFMYTDLLSGNFSLPATVFKQLNGFEETLRCREDYEFGVRLIKAGVDFYFSTDAWAVHRDEATDFSRSLTRKRQEGNADVQFGRLHPDLVRNLYFASYSKRHARVRRLLFTLVFRVPAIGNLFAFILAAWVDLLLKINSRKRWHKYSRILQYYWYMKGVSDQLPNLVQLRNYIREYRKPLIPVPAVDINLDQGMQNAEAQVDQLRPATVNLRYGDQFIGIIAPQHGAEPLRGMHLRAELAHRYSWQLSQALALDKLTADSSKLNSQPQNILYAN